MNQFKVLIYGGEPKFISSLSLLKTIRVVKPLNIFSLFKLVVALVFSKKIRGDDVSKYIDMDIYKLISSPFDVAVIGQEDNYKKITLVNISDALVTKVLLFNNCGLATDFHDEFTVNYDRLVSDFCNFDDIKIEKVKSIKLLDNSVTLVTHYIEGIKYNWFEILALLPSILDRIYQTKSGVVIKDFKLHNITMKNGVLYVYDLETLSKGRWDESVAFFIENLSFYAKYSLFCTLLRNRLEHVKRDISK